MTARAVTASREAARLLVLVVPRVTVAAVLVELHLERDQPQLASFLHQIARSGYSRR